MKTSSDIGLGSREIVSCPLCRASNSEPWAEENGFVCVRCLRCRLLYVNPRPTQDRIDRGIRLGVHGEETANLDVVGSWAGWKVDRFSRALRQHYPEWNGGGKPVRWLDVGAGFGEMVEALRNTAPSGSWCEGIEPMVPKAEDAQRRGFPVRAAYLCDVSEKYDVASIVDIFSHVPDFRSFLGELKEVLLPRGEIFIKTGNGADVGDRCRIPEPLNLPDHLVFAGRAHLTQFLEEAGFEVVSLSAHRVDGLIYSARNTVKWLIGKPVRLGLPYASPLRTIYLRARLREG